MNTTIGPDLERKPLEDENVCYGKNNNNNNVPVNGNSNANLYQSV